MSDGKVVHVSNHRRILDGDRTFYCVARERKIDIVAFDLDCGATAYGYIYDIDGYDHEYLDICEVSSLIPVDADFLDGRVLYSGAGTWRTER